VRPAAARTADPRQPEAAGSAGQQAAAAAGAAGGRSAAARSLPVHLDADVVVVRKPPGILTVPFDRGDRDTLLALARIAVRRQEARETGEGRRAALNPTLRAVQRLDRDTSGLVVFARSVAAQRDLQRQLAERTVTRRYEALVHGAARDATFDTWLVRDRGDGLRGSWGVGPAGGRGGAPPADARRAVTLVRVIERLRGATHVACELETGRQHQIRIHLAEAGHPLLGEAVYIRDFSGPRIAAPRPMLHAATLGFRHPRDGRPVLCEEPPPEDFAELLARLRHRARPLVSG
jgi:23S rRNA pseudouridine1911/1915/1917 synthase